MKNKHKVFQTSFLLFLILCCLSNVSVFQVSAKENLPVISNLTASSKNESSLTLKWKKQKNVSGYEIKTYDSKKKSYVTLCKLSKNNTSYTIKNLKPTRKYKYKIRIYKKQNGKNSYGKYSKVYTFSTKPKKPKLVLKNSNGQASIIWNKDKTVSKFLIYAYDSGNGSYTQIGTVKNTKNSYTLPSFRGTRKYKVRAYRKNGSQVTYNDSKTLTVNTNRYTVSFHPNGADAGSMKNISANLSDDVDLPENTYSKTGYAFIGWNTKKDGSGKSYDDADYVSPLTSKFGVTITLYAQWKPIAYTVSFDGNYNDSGIMKDMSCSYDKSYSIPKNSFTRSGYTFIGWGTSDSDTSAIYKDQAVIKNLTDEDDSDICLYALWKRNSYTVSYNSNDGNGKLVSSTFNCDQDYSLSPNKFLRTGYNFVAWNTKPDGSGDSYSDEDYVYNLSVTNGATVSLYAQWEPITYTISFDGNDNTGGNIHSISLKYDEEISLPKNVFTRTGYLFTDWNLDKDGYGTAYGNVQKIKNLSATDGDDIILYAQWKAGSYTITYDNNGGNGYMSPVVPEYDENIRISDNSFSKTGYSFVEWNTKPDGSGSSFDAGEITSNISDLIGDNITLYAQWTQNSYVIRYMDNGSVVDETACLYDTVSPLASNTCTKEGYTANGWNTSANGQGNHYNNGQSIINLTSAPDGVITLYSQWTANPYSIKYCKNGGSGEMANSHHIYDTASNLTANSYTKTGYTFKNWNTASDGTGTSYSNGASVKNAAPSGTLSLYAQWNPIKYTIVFDGVGGLRQDGTKTTYTQTFSYTEKKALTGNRYKKSGKKFAGWNTSKEATKEGKVLYKDKQEVSKLYSTAGKRTFYAVWK